MRKIYATLTVPVIIIADEGVDIDAYFAEAELSIKSTDRVDIIDATIENVEITDSK